MDKRFNFRKELITTNKPINFTGREKDSDEISFLDGVIISGYDGAVINHAKKDFADFLKVGFGIKENGAKPVKISLSIQQENLEDVCAYKGRIIFIDEDIINNEYGDNMKKYSDVLLYKTFRPVITFLFKVFYRPQIIGSENIPKSGRVILAGNHRHSFDPIVVIMSTKRARKIVFLALNFNLFHHENTEHTELYTYIESYHHYYQLSLSLILSYPQSQLM